MSKRYIAIDHNYDEEKVCESREEVEDFLNEGLDAGSAQDDMEVYELGKKLDFHVGQRASLNT